MTVIVDTSGIESAIRQKMADVLDPTNALYRQVAVDLVPMIHERIHVDGKAANGAQIGTYTNEYMKVRTGVFGNADLNKKGKNVGKNKNAGTATKGARKGENRNQFHRSSDTKVILSLSRQMENDYAVIGLPDGWGIGFNNAFNADKARWNDTRYGKKVFELTDNELEYAQKRTETLVEDNLNRK